MNIELNRKCATLVLIAVLLSATFTCSAARKPSPIPDLTKGGVKDNLHDWNLGPTGARGWIWGWKLETTNSRQILITKVDKGSPSDGILEVGDVILGAGGKPFSDDARKSFGGAITEAEKHKNRGILKLIRWRNGETKNVKLKLRAMGSYSDTAPYNCAKSQKILEAGCKHIAANMKGSIQGTVNALALLASGQKEYAQIVKDFAHKIGPPDLKLSVATKKGMPAWSWGYNNIFLTEYYLVTGDKYVLPAIKEYSVKLSMGQSFVGTWGHGMAWMDINNGKLHGSLGGYGAMNQPGLTCHMSLVLAKKCGIQHKEIDMAIEKANKYFSFYINKGSIPYGDHRPGWQWHDDNGKDSSGTIMFDLQGIYEGAKFFSKMTVASYGEREQGHTGNYFSYLWGPLGANRAGSKAAAAFLKEQRWFYDLARRWDDSFIYQGGAGANDSYRGWDCTGVFILPCAMPLKKLYVTGKGTNKANELTGRELADVIEAGRGYTVWGKGLEVYYDKSSDELLGYLRSWSPAVRYRASVALAKKDVNVVPQLIRMLDDDDLTARYGACQAITELKGKGAPAVDILIKLLRHDDVWLRIQSCYALAGIGEPARKAVPEMLKLAVRQDPDDPRQFTQRFLAFTLFSTSRALGNPGVVAKSLEGVDLELLYPAVKIMLRNDDGRARGAVGSVYKNLTIEELRPILPDILRAIEEPSPSGVMFSSGIRLQGLSLLARHHIKEGLPLCLKTMEIHKWGKKSRVSSCLKTLRSYGPAAAKTILGELRQLEKDMLNHREAKSVLSGAIKQVREIITEAQAAKGQPKFVPLDQIMAGAKPISQGIDSSFKLELKQKTRLDLSLLNESRHSLEIAFKYFCDSQQPNGSWKYDPAITALVLYSFMLDPEYNPDAKTAKVIKKGYAFLEKFVKPNGGIFHEQYRNYSTAVSLMAFAAAGKAEYQSIIDNAKKYLIKFQLDEGEDISPRHAFYGGIGYGGDTRPDLSNLHLALEGIKAAEDFVVISDDILKLPGTKQDLKKEKLEPHWQKALVFLSRTQNIKSINDMDYATNDGGFIYETGHYKPERSISYGSMTYAGLKSLLYAGIDKSDIRVKKAYAWICDNYTVQENPRFGTTSLYYYFMTATKCLTAFGGDVVIDTKGKKHYWREDFLEKIISLQHELGHWVNPDGRYQENIKDLATAYSVIAIKHALHDAY